MILDQLSAMDVLEEMSEFEKQEYSKKPTLLNALIVPLKTEIRLTNASTLQIKTGDVTGEIFYEWKNRKSLDDLIILKSTGDVSKLPIDEQKAKIIEAYKTIINEGIKKYGDIDKFIDAMRNDSKLDLTPSNDEEENKVETKQESIAHSNSFVIEKLNYIDENIQSEVSEETDVNINVKVRKRKLNNK